MELREFVLNTLFAALTLALAYAARLIRQHVKQAYFQGALLRLDEVLVQVVAEGKQKADEMKAKNGGKLAAQDIAQLELWAVGLAKAFLGERGLKAILKVLLPPGAIGDEFLGSRVAALAQRLKATPLAAAAATLGATMHPAPPKEGAAAGPLAPASAAT